ncbi:MAG: dihydroorotase [Cyanobacteriota bacterium]|nr:dihydroorotase [Cyanobacteriota bacterium]
MNKLLQQVRIVDPVSGVDRIADVLLADGAIAAIEENITESPPQTQQQDCRGCILGPGLVDLYSHNSEPGFEERDTLDSIGQAALAGGFTRLALLPTSQPPLDNPSVLSFLQNRIPPTPSFHFWGALTCQAAGEEMTELVELAAAGVVGFADGEPLENLGLVRRLLEYAQPLAKPIALWPRDRHLSGEGAMREGAISMRLGVPGTPVAAETSALAALLECIAETQTPTHIMRVSTARGVELIRAAKANGLPVTASTTWMHLLLDSKAIGSYDPNLRLDPPLGNPDDRTALVAAVKSGVLDAIAIDNTPYTYEEKTVPFAQAPPGAIGWELALPLLWQELVADGDWSALELWRALSTGPALCLGQTPGRVEIQVEIDRPAELVLFASDRPWEVSSQTLKSRSTNTPWLGKSIVGRILQTWCAMGNFDNS